MPCVRSSRSEMSLYAWGLVVMAAFLLSAAAIGLIVWRSVSKRVVERTGEHLMLSAGSLYNLLNRLLLEHARHVQVIAQAPILQRQHVEHIAGYFRDLQRIFPSYIRLTFTDSEDRLLASTSGEESGSPERWSAWFRSLRQGSGLQLVDVADGRPFVLMAARAEDETGQVMGALVMQIGVQRFVLALAEALYSSCLLWRKWVCAGISAAGERVVGGGRPGQLVSLNQLLAVDVAGAGSVAESRLIDLIFARMMDRLAAPDALLKTISELSPAGCRQL